MVSILWLQEVTYLGPISGIQGLKKETDTWQMGFVFFLRPPKHK